MTLEEKIGQMLVFGWSDSDTGDSKTLNPHAAALVDDFAVGGIILMGRNVGTPEQVRGVVGALQERTEARGLPPLFVATDQEGGRVSRFAPPHFTAMPAAWTIGKTGKPDYAHAAARALAEELAEVGINWDFAPILDVNNNPANPVIGDRSYSDDPQIVAKMGVAAIAGFAEGGVLSCAKHFPGHGDTDTDSHLALPRISHPLTRLREVELVPFVAAIAAGVPAIMTSHILFEALDPALPATLSPKILTGLLREELGYDGLLITDCLEMKGVADGWGEAEAAVLSVLAGADLLLCCHTWATQIEIRDALLEAVQSGRLTEAHIDESLARIARAKTLPGIRAGHLAHAALATEITHAAEAV